MMKDFRTFKTLKDLKEVAIAISHPLEISWPFFSKSETLLPSTDPSLEKCYDCTGDTIAFMSDYILYIIPSMKRVTNILNENGFIRKSMIVPFSNGDYPVIYENYWENLKRFAKEENLKDFIEDCNKFSDKYGFGILDDALLEKCFEIPTSGVFTTDGYWYFPLVNGHILDCIAIERIGHYSIKNGTCVFIYRNGKTYVTRDWNIVMTLHNAGYIRGDLFVPFSNGEKIKFPEYAAQYEKMSL